MNTSHVLAETRGNIGVLTLNRPQALNALSLEMVRSITSALQRWAVDDDVHAVLLRGAGREGKPPAFCAGGDIRLLHQAALADDVALDDFFTEEYTLNHLIHRYAKPVIALMDGITMGGGMGLAQGAALRVVTEHSQLAMPETLIGLFPDVGGGWFLSRCPGQLGEFLALSGQVLRAADAIDAGLADVFMLSSTLPMLVEALTDQPMESGAQALATVKARSVQAPAPGSLAPHRSSIDRHFALPTLADIMASLEADASPFAQALHAALSKRSPLMMAVALEQVRRARGMQLADELRMERGLRHHCFHLRTGAASEAIEGIRALVVDKDHRPQWNPSRIKDLRLDAVDAFFAIPWPAHVHPLRWLKDD